jgi:electron transport complex protein RnfG
MGMKKFFSVLLLGVTMTSCAFAKSNVSLKHVIEGTYTDVKKIEAKSLILSQDKFNKVRKSAKTALDTKVYRYYDILGASGTLGKGVLITRKVRSKKATVLYAFDTKGTLLSSEIMAFGEPPEYIPSGTWMGQFQGQTTSAPLTIGKDIPTISGATLSASSITEGARIARALYTLVLKSK